MREHPPPCAAASSVMCGGILRFVRRSPCEVRGLDPAGKETRRETAPISGGGTGAGRTWPPMGWFQVWKWARLPGNWERCPFQWGCIRAPPPSESRTIIIEYKEVEKWRCESIRTLLRLTPSGTW